MRKSIDIGGVFWDNARMDKVMAYIGMATGLTGSALVASLDFALAGWCMFAVSNIAWVVSAVLTRNVPLAIMQVGFAITTTIGIVNNV